VKLECVKDVNPMSSLSINKIIYCNEQLKYLLQLRIYIKQDLLSPSLRYRRAAKVPVSSMDEICIEPLTVSMSWSLVFIFVEDRIRGVILCCVFLGVGTDRGTERHIGTTWYRLQTRFASLMHFRIQLFTLLRIWRPVGIRNQIQLSL
jgi:hypothetical protein